MPAQIYDSTWTIDASGNWSDGSNWATQVPIVVNGQQQITIEPVVPGADDAVSLAPGGTAPYTVTFDTTDEVYSLGSSGTASATLAVQGGALTIDQGGLFAGAVAITGGTVDAVDGWTVSGGFSESAGATVEVGSGGMLAVSTGTIAGSISGAGELYLIGGDTFTLAHGASVTTGTFELGVNGDGNGSTTTLGGNFTYSGLFLLDNYSGNDATLDLAGHAMTIAGSATLNGEITGPGTFTVKGTAAVADGGYALLTVAGGAVLVDAGQMTQYQNVDLSSTLDVDAKSLWDIVEDSSIANSASAVIVNHGRFEKTAGTNTSYIAAALTNAGTVSAASGTLDFQSTVGNTGLLTGGTVVVGGAFTSTGSIHLAALTLQGGGSVGGKLGGTGTLAFTNGGTYGIVAGTVLSMATLDVSGALLNIAGDETFAGALNVSDGTLGLDGFTLATTGAVALDNAGVTGGALSVADGTLSGVSFADDSTLVDTGLIVQSGYVQLGSGASDQGVLLVGASDTYDLGAQAVLGNVNRNVSGLATITSSGLFQATGTAGYADIFNSDFSSSGTLLVAAGGGLALYGPQASLSGSIGGGGSLYLGTAWTLSGPDSLTIASIENDGAGTLEVAAVVYAGAFINDGGGTVDLNGDRLSLTGTAALSGSIGNGGTVTVADGSFAAVIYGDATLNDTGTITQTGGAQIGGFSTDAASLVVRMGATYDIAGGYALGNGNQNDTGVATIDNFGLFEMTGSGYATVWHADFTNHGTLLSNAELSFSGNDAVLGGTITGSGGIALDTTWTLESAAVVSVATLENGGVGNLTGAFAYAGAFTNDNGATIDLHGNTLTLSGADAISGSVGDGGSVSLANATDGGLVVYGDATLTDTGVITQNSGSVDLGSGSTDAVTLAIRAGATYDFAAGGWLGNPNVNDTGTSTIRNLGLFENTSGAAVDVWHSDITSTGTILTDSLLALVGPTATLSGVLSGSGDLQLDTTWTLAAGTSVTVGTLENGGAGSLLGNVVVHGGLADDGGTSLALGGHSLDVKGLATLDGSISGAGSLILDGDTATVSGASITAATLQMQGAATLTLGSNLSYGAQFIDSAGAAVSHIELGGNTLVLSGVSTLSATRGSVDIGGGTITNAGSLTQSGTVVLGDATGAATVGNAAAGTWDFTADVGLGVAGSGASFANAGLFEKTAGSGLSNVAAAFSNTGTVEVTSGTLEFSGGFTNSGTVIGTISMSGGNVFVTALQG